jgi:hypothetical protein
MDGYKKISRHSYRTTRAKQPVQASGEMGLSLRWLLVNAGAESHHAVWRVRDTLIEEQG